MDCMLSNEMTMFEILSRTSLKTLDAIRCANKEFDTITYNSYFLDLYKKRNNIVSGFLVQNLKGSLRYIKHFVPSPHSETIDLRKALPRNARILASSEQGLIFIESKDHLNPNKVLYQVCKPTTRQSLEVPNPNLDYVTQKAAIVIMGLNPLRFKIVRLSQPLLCSSCSSKKYYYEIFDSKTKAWSLPYPISKFPAGAFLLDDAQEPITTGGSINMLLNNNRILKFNVYSEEWTVFSTPIPARKYQDYTCKRLVKFEGKLGFTCKSPDGSLKTWVRGANQSWKSLYVISSKKEGMDRKSLVALYDSDTGVMVDSHEFEFYRFKQNKGLISKVLLNDHPTRMFVFRSDFEPIDEMMLGY